MDCSFAGMYAKIALGRGTTHMGWVPAGRALTWAGVRRVEHTVDCSRFSDGAVVWSWVCIAIKDVFLCSVTTQVVKVIDG